MTLPAAQHRELVHTRQVTYFGYHREDGLWDIEAVLLDSKPVIFEVVGERTWKPNEPIHNIIVRLTVNSALVLQDIHVSLDAVPHEDCALATPPIRKLIGASMTSGWRKSIEEHLGKTQSCAHLRELLFNAATAAFQTVAGVLGVTNPQVKPLQLDRCITWRTDSELVHRKYPMFFQPSTPSKDTSSTE